MGKGGGGGGGFGSTEVHWWGKLKNIFLEFQLYYIKKKRVDHSHLYPYLEVPGLTCPGQETNPANRALYKRAIQTAC